MHLGNGAITPECAVITWGAAATGLAICTKAAYRTGSSPHKLELAAALGCLVFAAQAINVQVAPNFSGHLVGGVLLAALLGPGLGALVMAAILLLQAALLGDGGLVTLGANVLNMALLPAGLIAALQRSVDKTPARWLVAAMSGLAVALAAVLIVGETAFFRSTGQLTGWGDFAARMIGSHLWIGLLEAGATFGVLWIADAIRQRTPAIRPVLVGAACALLAIAAILPVSSSLPDGYEAAAEASGMEWLLK